MRDVGAEVMDVRNWVNILTSNPDIYFIHFSAVTPSGYQPALDKTYVMKELKACRNIRPAFNSSLGENF